MTHFNPSWRKIADYLGIDLLVRKLNRIIKGQKQLDQQLAQLNSASHGADKGTQINLALRYQELAKLGKILPFDDVEFRNYSQFGEDGILHYVFSLIGTTNKLAVEICAGIGSECNSANLIIHHGWIALLIDGDEKNVEEGRQFFASHPDTKFSPPQFQQHWITRDNINTIIRDAGFAGDIDLLSLDMDGVDYWVWEAIDAISPRVVILEVNAHMGEEALTVPYADDFTTQWIRLEEKGDGPPDWSNKNVGQWTMYGGASLAAFNKLAKRKGYRLVGSNRFGVNAVFLRDDVGAGLFPEIDESMCYSQSTQLDRDRGAKVLLQQDLVKV